MLFAKKQPDVRSEIQRRKSQSRRILELLKKLPNGTITNIDLQRIALNYTMRVSELRKDGWEIQADYDKPGVYRYYLKGRAK